MSIEAPAPTARGPALPSRRWLRRGLAIAAIALALCLGGAISLSKPFQEGSTRIFGRIVDGIKDHPRATLAICLGGVLAIWLSIGAITAAQELRRR